MTPQPLRVLMVTKGLDHGGLERAVVTLAADLRQLELPVEIAVINSRRLAMIDDVTARGIPVRLLDGSDRIGLRSLRQLRHISREVDLMHAHGPLVTVACRLVSTTRVVSTAHSDAATWHRISRLLWRWTARRTRPTVAVSPRVAQSLPGGHTSTVITNGIDVAQADRARQLRDATRATLPFAAESRVIGMISSHRSVKNHASVIRCLALLDVDTHLLAIGEGPLLAEHRRLAQDLGLGSRVHFLAPRNDILPLMAALDVLVVASRSEGQPMVVGEALSVGVPVVTSAVGMADQLVSDRVGRVVQSTDPDTLAQALREVLDPVTHAQLVEATSHVDLQTSAAAAAEYAAWYRSVSTSHAGRPR